MEILKWLNPGKIAERMGERWSEAPSAKDPTKSNFQVLFDELVTDVEAGRPLSQPYPLWQPFKESARRGAVAAAITHVEKRIREGALHAPAEEQPIQG